MGNKICLKPTTVDPYDNGAMSPRSMKLSQGGKSLESGREKKPVEQILTKEEKLEDFNAHGDDNKKLTEKQMAKLNKFQQFEHKFPFYLMDVNGFMHRVKEAMIAENPEHEH